MQIRKNTTTAQPPKPTRYNQPIEEVEEDEEAQAGGFSYSLAQLVDVSEMSK